MPATPAPAHARPDASPARPVPAPDAGTMRPAPPHAPARPAASIAYLRTALVFLVPGGSLLGAWMILQLSGFAPLVAWPAHLRSHSHMQVFGFVVLFTMGIALLVVPRLTGAAPPRGPLALLPLAGVASGVLSAVAGFPRLAAGLETLGVAAFVVVVRTSVARSEGPASPLTRVHRAFATSGALWLLAAAASGLVAPANSHLDLVLWGFASLYIMAVGILVHPRILGLKPPPIPRLTAAMVVWNLGLLARLSPLPAVLPAALLLVGGGLYLVALNPFAGGRGNCEAPPWLRFFLRFSYGWLAVTLLANLAVAALPAPAATAGPLRHALASGFILTMIVGMAFRIVPNFVKVHLAWPKAPWIALAVLTSGNVLRVGAQAALAFQVPAQAALALGGLLQFAAVLVFGFTLWASLGRPLEPQG